MKAVRFSSTHIFVCLLSEFVMWKTRWLGNALKFIVGIMNCAEQLMYLLLDSLRCSLIQFVWLLCEEMKECGACTKHVFCRFLRIDCRWMCKAIVYETIHSTGRPSTDNGHHAAKYRNENQVFFLPTKAFTSQDGVVRNSKSFEMSFNFDSMCGYRFEYPVDIVHPAGHYMRYANHLIGSSCGFA